MATTTARSSWLPSIASRPGASRGVRCGDPSGLGDPALARRGDARRINVEGSRRVFEGAAAAEGTPTSFYSRHKVAVERELDRFEAGNPETGVVRLRPALIFKDKAATEIRRLFIGLAPLRAASGPRPVAAPRSCWRGGGANATPRSARPRGGALIVLGSWALLAYLKDEASADRVESAWLEEGATICSVNLGEVLYIRMRGEGDGEGSAIADVDRVRRRLNVVDPDWPLVSEAARIKAHGGLSYADAFCVATARRADAPLWTGDPEIVDQAAEHSCKVVDLRVPHG